MCVTNCSRVAMKRSQLLKHSKYDHSPFINSDSKNILFNILIQCLKVSCAIEEK